MDRTTNDGIFKVRPRDHQEHTIQVPRICAGSWYRRFTEGNGERIVFERVT